MNFLKEEKRLVETFSHIKHDISVIIPALNEEKNIKKCIESVKRFNPLEIIVVDGGSSDKTREYAKQAGALVVNSKRGRGLQMNIGASLARGDVLLFLHADCFFEDNVNKDFLYENFLEDCTAAFFRLKFDDNSLSIKFIELSANLRSRIFSLPYGDQALIVKKRFFKEIGGFLEYPFLEDIDFVIRIRKYGKLKCLPYKITVSSRRYKKRYPFLPILLGLRNSFIVLSFLIGVRPEILIKFYK